MDSVSNDGAEPADLKRPRRKRQFQTPLVDGLPPHSEECERGTLGCALLDPSTVLPELTVIFGKAGKEVYYDVRHQTIYAEMQEMIEDGIKIDVVTMATRLKAKQMLQEVGGMEYLQGLPDAVPSSANSKYYADYVVEKYVLRKAIHTCTDLVSKIYESEGNVDELMDEFEREAMRIREGMRCDEIPDLKSCVQGAVQQIEDYISRAGQLVGLPTGFTDLDKMMGGLEAGTVFVIAARPSMGKTSLAMNIAEHVAIDQGLPVGVFSLEMTRQSLVLRMLCSRARVNLRNIREGFMAERDFPKLTGSAGKMVGANNIWIEDISGLSIMQLRAKARRMVQQYGIKLFVIDYLQLLHATIGNKRIENRAQEVSEVSGGVKGMAKELKVPVIVLSQINRQLDREKNRKPTMSDLRESGAIEQDADAIGFLYKPKREEDDDLDYSEAIPVNLIIAKQRNGPTGEIPFTFLKCFTRFENAAKVSDDDVPDDRQQSLV